MHGDGVERGDDLFGLGMEAGEMDGRLASVRGGAGDAVEQQWPADVTFAVGKWGQLANGMEYAHSSGRFVRWPESTKRTLSRALS